MALGTHRDQGAGLEPYTVALRTPGLGVLGYGFPKWGSPVSPPPTGAGGAIPILFPVASSPAAPGTGRVTRLLTDATRPPRGVGNTRGRVGARVGDTDAVGGDSPAPAGGRGAPRRWPRTKVWQHQHCVSLVFPPWGVGGQHSPPVFPQMFDLSPKRASISACYPHLTGTGG